MSRFDPTLGVGRDELGAIAADLQNQINAQALKNAQFTVQGLNIPIIDSLVGYTQSAGIVFVTFRYTGYGSAVNLRNVFVKRADIITEDDYNMKRLSGKLADSIPPGTTFHTSQVDIELEPDTEYDVIGLVAIGADGAERIRNPTPDPVFADYPGNVLFTFTTPALGPEVGAPSKPTIGRVIANSIDAVGDGTLGYLTLRVFADETELLTFGEQGAVDIQVKLLKASGGHAEYVLAVSDPSLTFMDFTIGDLSVGQEYLWTKNTAFDSHGTPASALATPDVSLFIGGFADPSDGLAGLTFVLINPAPLDDGTRLRLKWRLNQPSPAYRLVEYILERKLSTEADIDYIEVIEPTDIRAPKYNTPGDIVIRHTVDTSASTIYDFRLTVTGTDGFSKQFLSGDITTDPAAFAVDTADAGAISNLSLVWSEKKGWNSFWDEPTTFWDAPRGFVISFYYNDGANTYWMNPETGALLATVAEATVTTDERDTTNTGTVKVYVHTESPHWKSGIKALDTNAIFLAPGVKIRVRARNLQVAGRVISANYVDFGSYVGAGTDGAGTAAPTAIAFPSAPSTANNTVDGDPETSLARIALTLATTAGTFSANNVSGIEIIMIRRDATNSADVGDPFSEYKALSTADLAATSCVHEFYKRMGQKFRITKVVARNGDKRAETTGTADFTAGNVLTVASGDAKVVPAPTYQVAAAIDGNKHVTATVRLTQDGTDSVLFKKLVIQVSTGGGAFEDMFEIGLKAEDALYATAGTTNNSFKDFPIRLHRKPSASFQLRVYAVAVGGKASANTDSSVLGAGTDDGATTPTAIAFPTAPTGANNSVDGDPDGNLARIALTLATVSGTFTANNVSQIEIVLIRRDATNAADVGDPFSQIKVLSTADLALSSVVHEFYLKVGQRFRITKVVARNGDKRAETTGTADFLAGGFILTGTCPAPSFQSQPAADGNKIASFTIRLVNNATPVLFKNLTIEVSYGGGTFRNIEGSPVGLKSNDLLNVASATADFVFSCKRKPGVTLDVRATARMVGGSVSTTTNATQLAASTDDVATDTAVPTLATNPDTSNTGPTVQANFGLITAYAVTPSAQINTLDKFQFILQTANTTPAGTPSVGSEDVIKIKESPSGVQEFRAKQAQYSTTLWVRFRAHNSIGYSAWSAGTSIVPSRPLEDVIGDDVPTMPEKLERTATGTYIDSTHFDLDAGASAVTDFYKDMALYISIANSDDQVVRITAYNGSTKRCTVTPAFNASYSTPTFRIHRIGYPDAISARSAGPDGDWAGRSGTGHTSTTFVLDSGASAVNDFYLGYSLWVTPHAGGDRFRRVTAYNGTTKVLTLDAAWGSTPSGAKGFILVAGSWGTDSADGTGGVSAAPFRLYLDGDQDPPHGKNVVEVLIPLGKNAYSLTDFQVRVYRESTSGLKLDSNAQKTSGSAQYSFVTALSQARRAAIRFRNQYRGGGSDGWTANSAYVTVYLALDSTPATTPNYDPGAFPPNISDYQGVASYPDQRYSVQ